MKVDIIYNDELIIVPETDFEDQWLQLFKPGDVFHKSGMTPADFLGLKICRKEVKNELDNLKKGQKRK